MTDATFWKERWIDGRAGWHRNDVNPTLVAHWEAVGLDGGDVLVPLCGRSLDLAWLRDRGHAVTGIELSDLAAHGVFEDAGLEVRFDDNRLTGDGITVIVDDIFNVDGLSGNFDAAWDRAALVALPPEMRRLYATRLVGMLRPSGRILLNAFCYPQQDRDGPPFSVPPEEVLDLFGGTCEVSLLDSIDVMDDSHRERGYTACREDIHLICKR